MHDVLGQTFLVIGGSFAAVAALARYRISPIVGYLAAGLLLGPTGLAIVPPDTEGTHFLGELGIALLMFVIGLEFSLPRLIAAGPAVLGYGFATVATVVAIAAAVAHIAAGLPLALAIIVGGAVAMSSTAIVHKHLIDTDETTSRHGVAVTRILLFEDLVALVLLAVVSGLHGGVSAANIGPVLTRLTIGILAFGGVALLARRTVGRLLEWVAKAKVNEIFLLAVLTLILGASLAAQAIGLSLPLGAFVVGMIIAESDFRHQLEDEIRPFRDLLVGIFFITIGMSVDWTEIAGSAGATAAIFGAIVVAKLAVVTTVCRVAGTGRASSLKAGLMLAHSGELGLLVIGRCLEGSLLPAPIGQPLLGAIALSMLTGPILAQFGNRLAEALGLGPDVGAADDAEAGVRKEGAGLEDHVVLAGCGPVGRLVAVTLEGSGIPYVAIERDVERLRKAQVDGHLAVFGDATRPRILDAAGVERARALVVLVNDWRQSARIVREAKRLNPTIQVIASLRDDASVGELVEAGASHVFPENYAAGLGLAAQALLALGMSPAEAMDRVRAVRAHLSPALRTTGP